MRSYCPSQIMISQRQVYLVFNIHTWIWSTKLKNKIAFSTPKKSFTFLSSFHMVQTEGKYQNRVSQQVPAA